MYEYSGLKCDNRGGFALVWLGVEKKTGKKLAVKQILKGAASDSQKKELYFGQLLFNKGGEPRDELKRYPGICSGNRVILMDFL